MWRVRQVFFLIGAYFFWLAVYQSNDMVGAYGVSQMLTYIILVSIMNALVFSSRSYQVASDIGSGSLNQYLIRPVRYFIWMFFLDLGDKGSNFVFLLLELPLFLLLFRPPFFIQTNIFYIVAFLAVLALGVVTYFFLSLLISLFTFWYPEQNGWPVRFLFDILLVFLSGGWFPLDIMPAGIFKILQFLPFGYLRFFPAKVYLGQLGTAETVSGFGIMLAWTVILISLTKILWRKGLKVYAAEGI